MAREPTTPDIKGATSISLTIQSGLEGSVLGLNKNELTSKGIHTHSLLNTIQTLIQPRAKPSYQKIQLHFAH